MYKNLVIITAIAVSFFIGHAVALRNVEKAESGGVYFDDISVSSGDPCGVDNVEDDEFVLDVCVEQFDGNDFKSFITIRYLRYRINERLDVKTSWKKTMEDGIEYATQILNGDDAI